jgi:hypothetical protein
MKKIALWLCTLAVGALAAGVTPAPAAAMIRSMPGYLCGVSMNAPDSWNGDYGSLYLEVYSQPFCKGTWLGGVQAFSPNHGPLCGDHDNVAPTFSEMQLGLMYEKAIDAAERGQKMQVTGNQCWQLIALIFYAVH